MLLEHEAAPLWRCGPVRVACFHFLGRKAQTRTTSTLVSVLAAVDVNITCKCDLTGNNLHTKRIMRKMNPVARFFNNALWGTFLQRCKVLLPAAPIAFQTREPKFKRVGSRGGSSGVSDDDGCLSSDLDHSALTLLTLNL